MTYMMIIFLLLSAGIGQTTQQQSAYRDTYQQNRTIVDAPGRARRSKLSPRLRNRWKNKGRTT
jgi:hypothetical protein